MHLAVVVSLLMLVVASSAAKNDGTVLLESFQDPQHEWVAMNDPVMGGKSKGTISIRDGKAHFQGQVAIVPYLQAPGFITIQSMPRNGIYQDVSSCTALTMELQANVEYSGYRISFGRAHVPGGRFAFGYKSNFTISVSEEMQTLTIPFDDFTDNWDDATGNAKVTCHENSQYCPTTKVLHNIQTISIWGEGVEGTVDLEIKSIGASGCETEEPGIEGGEFSFD